LSIRGVPKKKKAMAQSKGGRSKASGPGKGGGVVKKT